MDLKLSLHHTVNSATALQFHRLPRKKRKKFDLLCQSSAALFRAIIQTGVTWIWTYNFCNYIMCLCCLSHLNGKRCLALSGWVFRVSYLEYGWLTWNSVIDSKTLKMPLTGSVNEFFLFSLHCIRLLILPWVSVSLSHCVILACFPPYVHLHTPSATFFFLSCSMSLLFTFVLLWLDLDKPNSSNPWYPVLPPAFPEEWTNLMINSVSLLQHAHTHTHTPQMAT